MLHIFETIDIASPEFGSIATNILFYRINVDRRKSHVPVQYAYQNILIDLIFQKKVLVINFNYSDVQDQEWAQD